MKAAFIRNQPALDGNPGGGGVREVELDALHGSDVKLVVRDLGQGVFIFLIGLGDQLIQNRVEVVDELALIPSTVSRASAATFSVSSIVCTSPVALASWVLSWISFS